MRKYPIEQSDIDEAIERAKIKKIERAIAKKKNPAPNKFTSSTSRKQRRADREWIRSRKRVMTLDEATKQLNNDGVYYKAIRGLPVDD